MSFKYIKGKEVIMDEHMYSASEIAALYGIYTSSKSRRPHGMMISALLRLYIKENNLNVSDYFYPHSRGVMKVYPEAIWRKAMTDFIFHNNLEMKSPNEDLYLKIDMQDDKKVYQYHYEKRDNNKIINFTERRKFNVD